MAVLYYRFSDVDMRQDSFITQYLIRASSDVSAIYGFANLSYQAKHHNEQRWLLSHFAL